MNETVVDTLKKARALLEPKGSWTQGALARTKTGRVIGPECPNACQFCAIGALRAVGATVPAVIDTLSDAMSDYIPNANDAADTKHLHVLMAYDFAILMAEEEGH